MPNIFALGTLRYFNSNADSLVSLDAGISFGWEKNRLAATGEWVYRSSPNSTINDNGHRLDMVINYNFAPNKAVSFTFGKDYNERYNGNLIAALNLILGFGGEKEINFD